MLGLGNFPLPEALQQELLAIFEEGNSTVVAMIRDGSPRLGRYLIAHHREIDKPLSRQRALVLLELDPQSEEATRARDTLFDVDRLFGLIGQWYAFIKSGPPLPADFVARANEYFPEAGELQELFEEKNYHKINLALRDSRDLLDRGVCQWSSDTTLGIRYDAPREEFQRAVERLDVLLFDWKEIAEGYSVARGDLPLARQYGYIGD